MENYEEQNPYTMDPAEAAELQGQITEPDAAGKKRKAGFLPGLLAGLLIGIVLCCGIAAAVVMGFTGMRVIIGGKTSSAASNVLDDGTVSKINELSAYIDYYYNDDFDTEQLQDGLLHGLVDSLGDPYSAYYNAEEFADLQVDTTGKFYGIGAGLTQNTETMVVTISKVYSGTPAEEAGLMKGDIIVTVDGTDATSMELTKLVQMIRGEEGTTVHLEILRNDETLEFDVERSNITIPSVDGQMLEDGMGYIQVSEFQSETSEQFQEIFENLKTQGMEGVIIDLRGNPGGMLDTVVDMLDYMLPEGLLVYVEDNQGNRTEYKSDASCQDLPIVLLVDGNSASASEIFAGAMKDYEYATLVGTQTFGKGIVQTVFSLSDGDAVKLTTAKYYTPKGNYIHGVGISPDIELEYEWLGPEDSTTYDMQYDNQLIKAREVLKEKMENQN